MASPPPPLGGGDGPSNAEGSEEEGEGNDNSSPSRVASRAATATAAATAAAAAAASIQADLDSIEVSLSPSASLPASASAGGGAHGPAAHGAPSAGGPDHLRQGLRNGHAPSTSLIGGRAAFESIGSALHGVRVRLEEAAAAAVGNTGASASSATAAAARDDDDGRDEREGAAGGGSSSGGSSSGGPLSAIADRLRTLERAYSSRNPLSASASTPWIAASGGGGGPSSPSALASVDETGAAGSAPGGGGRDAAAESTGTVTSTAGRGRTANAAEAEAEADASAVNDASASSALASGAAARTADDEPFADSLTLKDDRHNRRNNLARGARGRANNASSSTLLASRRLAAGVGYVSASYAPAGASANADADDAGDDDGFGAARAGLLASIAERRGSENVATGAGGVGASSGGTILQEGATEEEVAAEEIEEIIDDDINMKEEDDFVKDQQEEEEEEEEEEEHGMMQMDHTPMDASATLPGPPPPGVSKDGTGGTTSRAAPPGQHGPPTVLYSWGIGSTGALLHEDDGDRITSTAGPLEAAGAGASGEAEEASGDDGATTSTSGALAAALAAAVVDPTSRLGQHRLLSISASANHAAASTTTGSIFSCGTNRYGVVDPYEPNDGAVIVKPRNLSECLGAARIVSVSCGPEHTAAVRANGMVMTWGSDGGGRLGHRRQTGGSPRKEGEEGDEERVGRRRPPAAMQLPPGRRALSARCGSDFTLVLTTRREVLGCGSWSDLRLATMPAQPPALGGMPISTVAAGRGHAVAVTEFGSAYAWGTNRNGCCGREFPAVVSSPAPMFVPETARPRPAHDPTDGGPATEVPFKNWARWDGRRHPPSLAEDVRVVDVACGSACTVMVCSSGRLLVCGSNAVGQLGLPPCEQICPATPVEHPEKGLDKRKFVSVGAGISHALVLDDSGDVWQTGSYDGRGPTTASSALVCVIRGRNVTTIAAGGHQCYALSSGVGLLSRQFSVASDSLMSSGKSKLGASEDWASSLLSGLDFLIGKVASEEKEIEGNEEKKEAASVKDLASRIEEILSWPAVLGSLFLDPAVLDDLYKRVIYSDGDCDFVRTTVAMAVQRGVDRGLNNLRSCGARFIYPESVRCLLLYLQCPLFSDEAVKHTSGSTGIIFDDGGNVFQTLCEAIVSLPFEGYRAFKAWATSLYTPSMYSTILIRPLLCHLDIILGASGSDWRFRHQLPVIVSVLRWLHEASEQCVPHIVPPEAFYSEAVSNLPAEAMYEDLSRWKEASHVQRSSNFFLSANPFLLSARGKRNLLQIENQLEMMQAATATLSYDAQQRGFVFDPYFVLAIDRKYMLQQTLQKVDKAGPGELRKQLKIVFKGEDGVDAGGVTKEFFQLLVAQLFDVSTGMWNDMGPNNTLHWFNGNCTWNRDGYHLVGVLLGLALYNGVLLDVDFPMAVYRKLLRQPLGLEDMVDKETSRGLQQLLDYDGDDVEDIFCLTFDHVQRDSFGKEHSIELKPGGANIPVRSENKEEYVLLYVKWLLVDSIQEQYEAFEAGFMQVMETSSIMHVLRPDELELLVVGTPDLDFAALQESAEYEGGYEADTPVVANFWKFVGSASHDTQVRLLKFSTGSCRAPIGGLGNMPFKIQKGDPEGRQLPSSHTCFNTLILPDYGDDYNKLSSRLSRAILECEGFGLQ